MRWRSADHYRRRAQEMKEAALAMTDETARENLLDLARQYEEMAERHATQKPDGHALKSP
jgi:hypothetical protein